MVKVAHYGHIPDKLWIGHESRQELIAIVGRQRGFLQHLQLFLLYGCNDGHLSITQTWVSTPKLPCFWPQYDNI